MRVASALVPGHISGFFQVCDEAKELERRGSRNCGPCIDAGVVTEVSARPADRRRIRITVNGEREPRAKTTSRVVEQILRLAPEPVEVTVNHEVGIPIGAGYGASGAGALGAALALSEALNLRLPREQLVRIAHVAEVACLTGLGDVGAQARGGLVIGLEPGAPPHGRWGLIRTPSDMRVVCCTLGQLATEEVLRDEELKERSRKLGGYALKELMKDPTPENFMLVSYEFSESLGLLDDELRALVRAAIKAGAIGASQVMLGRAVFALAREKTLEEVKRAFSDISGPEAVLVTSIDGKGARLLG
jgi:pantoate kinase